MATALPNNPNRECSICIKTPKILSCGHSFCLECLVRYIDGRTGTFPCPDCSQDVQIPQGGVNQFITNFTLQTLTMDILTTKPSTSHKPKHDCPNHIKKEVEYYCEPCGLGFCSKCIYKDHNDHKTLDLEMDSTREKVVEELTKSEQFLNKKIEDLEKTLTALLETSEKLKSLCDAACAKINEKTDKIIGELKENCQKRQTEIKRHFDQNDSKLTETQQSVMTQIKTIQTDLDTSCPTAEKPSLTLIYSLTKLQDLQKLCENMKTDIPPVTYVEWIEEYVEVCDILGSTVTKPLYMYQSGKEIGPTSTETTSGDLHVYRSRKGSAKPLHMYRPMSMVTTALYEESSVFKFNYKEIKRCEWYYSRDQHTPAGHPVLWSCKVWRHSYDRYLSIFIWLRPEDNPRVDSCKIQHTVTILNNDKDKNMIKTRTNRFTPECTGSEIKLQWDRLLDLSEGFIDNEGQFRVKFDILQVLDIEYK